MIKLNVFTLERLSNYNKDHRKMVNELKEDVGVRRYISTNLEGYIESLEEKSKDKNDNLIGMNVAYLNRKDGNIPVGLIGLDKFDSKYSIVYTLLEKYRGENLGLILLQDYAYHLVDDLGIERVYEYIDKNNTNSINDSKITGFENINDDTYVLKRVKR